MVLGVPILKHFRVLVKTIFCTYVYTEDSKLLEVSQWLYTAGVDKVPEADRLLTHQHMYTAGSCPQGAQMSDHHGQSDLQIHSLKKKKEYK